MEKTLINRFTMEMSLKPFKSLNEDYVKKICFEILKDWGSIIEKSKSLAMLFWISDGSDIIDWDGNLNRKVNWGRYIGFCNTKTGAYPPNPHYFTRVGKKYIEKPVKFTYKDISFIIKTLKKLAKEVYNKELIAGATFDPGPEFAYSPFKYKKHKEIIEGGPITHSKFSTSLGFVCCYKKLKKDNVKYAGFPKGIPEGTSFGTFLGRQFKLLANAVGFDYIWFSNGFGFSHFAWLYTGELFDGERFYYEKAKEESDRIISFWRDFRKECPDYPIEVRGSNFSVGMEISTDGTSIKKIYEIGKLKLPPVNPPWGSYNLCLEMVSYLSRLSKTPTDELPFRFYLNDPWFPSNPWWEYYNREPFDIYCPLTSARINPNGSVITPNDLTVLTLDNEKGEFDKCANLEVIPHLIAGFNSRPDSPGIITWVYPFDEYNDMLEKNSKEIGHIFFHDWYITYAIKSGLPLNTVISSSALSNVLKNKSEVLNETILLAPVPLSKDWKYGDDLINWVIKGGKVIFYGSLALCSEKIREFLGIDLVEPLDGELIPNIYFRTDVVKEENKGRILNHRSIICGGGIKEVLNKSKEIKVRVYVKNKSGKRVYSVLRSLKNGGMIGWIRGTLPFGSSINKIEPEDDKQKFYNAGEWLRYLLADFGYVFKQEKLNYNTSSSYCFVSRKENAFYITGYKPDTTVNISMRFPDGAPLLTEREALVENSTSTYSFDKSFQHECRFFVIQKKRSSISVKRLKSHLKMKRQYLVSGLENADVTVYPHLDSFDKITVVDGSQESALFTIDGEKIPFIKDKKRKVIVLKNVSGKIKFRW